MTFPLRTLCSTFVSVALLFAASNPAVAKKKKSKKGGGPTTPGEYVDWKGEVDELEILKTFSLSNYQRVVVSDFDSSDTPLPEEDDNSYEPAKEVLSDAVAPFVEGLRKESAMTIVTGAGGSGDLVISGRVEEMDPGSRAARYWGGFGAGSARTRLWIEFTDASSGETLLKMRQERRSGVGVAGGDYVKLMQRNLRAIGKDAALVLGAF